MKTRNKIAAMFGALACIYTYSDAVCEEQKIKPLPEPEKKEGYLSTPMFKDLEDVVRNSVLIQSELSKCNGTHIGQGYILTAKHCVFEYQIKFREGFNGNPFFPIKVVAVSTRFDLALCYAPALTTINVEPSNLCEGQIFLGDEVTTYSRPPEPESGRITARIFKKEFAFQDKYGIYLGKGVLRDKRFLDRILYRSNPIIYSLRLPAMEGLSGEGVFTNREGHVHLIGVMTSVDHAKKRVVNNVVMSSASFATGLTSIREFLQDYQLGCKLGSGCMQWKY